MNRYSHFTRCYHPLFVTTSLLVSTCPCLLLYLHFCHSPSTSVTTVPKLHISVVAAYWLTYRWSSYFIWSPMLYSQFSQNWWFTVLTLLISAFSWRFSLTFIIIHQLPWICLALLRRHSLNVLSQSSSSVCPTFAGNMHPKLFTALSQNILEGCSGFLEFEKNYAEPMFF